MYSEPICLMQNLEIKKHYHSVAFSDSTLPSVNTVK